MSSRAEVVHTLSAEQMSNKADALDKVRTETGRHLRKYARRIKSVGEEQVKAAFALNPDADPETVADEAFRIASQGRFVGHSTKRAIDG